MSAAQVTWDNPAAQVKWDDEQTKATPTPGFLDTLGREGASLGKTIIGIPGGIVHAFSDEPTPDEQDFFHGDTKGPKRVGLGIDRLTTQPVRHALDWYKNVFQGKIATPYEDALSVAPEAMGIGAAAPLADKIGEIAPAAVKSTVKSTIGNSSKLAKTAIAVGKPTAKMAIEAASDIPIARGLIKGAKAFRDVPEQVGNIWRKPPAVDSIPGVETSRTPIATSPDWLNKVGEKVDRTARPAVMGRRQLSLDRAPVTEAPASPIGEPKQLGEGVLEGEYLDEPQAQPVAGPKLLQRSPFTEAPASNVVAPRQLKAGPAARPKIWSRLDNLEDTGIKQSMEDDLSRHEAVGRREQWDANTVGGTPKWMRVAEVKAQQAAEQIMAEAEAVAQKPKAFTKTPGIASPKIATPKEMPDFTSLLKRSIAEAKAKQKPQ